MKPFLLVASLALIGSGCDQMIARFTHVPPHLTPASARHSALGEPGSFSAVGWAPSRDGRGFGTYVHDPTVANGCSEWDVEPAAELDNDGAFCRSFVP